MNSILEVWLIWTKSVPMEVEGIQHLAQLDTKKYLNAPVSENYLSIINDLWKSHLDPEQWERGGGSFGELVSSDSSGSMDEQEAMTHSQQETCEKDRKTNKHRSWSVCSWLCNQQVVPVLRWPAISGHSGLPLCHEASVTTVEEPHNEVSCSSDCPIWPLLKKTQWDSWA